jgi:hypothetical protein
LKRGILYLLIIGSLFLESTNASEYEQLERKQIAFFKDNCNLEDQTANGRAFPVAIAAILLPKIIETGIELGASALKKASEDRSDAGFAKTDEVNFAQVSYDGKINTSADNTCLVYFDGYFKEANEKNHQQSVDISKFCEIEKNGKRECILENAVKSHIFFESKLDLSNERRLKAYLSHLFFGDPVLENSFFSSTKDREILITIDVLSYEQEKPYGSIAFHLNNVSPNSKTTFGITDPSHGVVAILPKDNFTNAIEKQNSIVSDIKTKLQTAYPRPEPNPVEEEAEKTSEVKKALKKYCDNAPDEIVEKECPGGLGDIRNDLFKARAESVNNINRQRAIEWLQKEKYNPVSCNNKDDDSISSCLAERNIKPIKTSPLFIKVTATETKRGSKLWSKVADSLLSAKGDLAKTISEGALVDKNKLKATETEQEATAMRTFELAKDDVRLAEATQLSLPADATDVAKINAEISLKKAKMDVNAAARKLGIAQPYPELP